MKNLIILEELLIKVLINYQINIKILMYNYLKTVLF